MEHTSGPLLPPGAASRLWGGCPAGTRCWSASTPAAPTRTMRPSRCAALLCCAVLRCVVLCRKTLRFVAVGCSTHPPLPRRSQFGTGRAQLAALPRPLPVLPLQRVTVARSGFTNAQGTFEDFDQGGAGRKKETAEETAARLKREAREAREGVK